MTHNGVLPHGIAALSPDHHGNGVVAVTSDGRLYRSTSPSAFSDWTQISALPSASDVRGIAQHSIAPDGSFVVVSGGGDVWEIDPDQPDQPVLRTSSGPSDLVAIVPDRFDNSVLGVTGDGTLYQAHASTSWSTWNRIGRVPTNGRIIGFTDTNPEIATGDYVFLSDEGRVWEIDPRHLTTFAFRTDLAPDDVVFLGPNTLDDNVVGVTAPAEVYEALTASEWVTWISVGTLR